MTSKHSSPLTPADYLKKILTARVYDVATESALEPAVLLSKRLHNTALLKREDQQLVRNRDVGGGGEVGITTDRVCDIIATRAILPSIAEGR